MLEFQSQLFEDSFDTVGHGNMTQWLSGSLGVSGTHDSTVTQPSVMDNICFRVRKESSHAFQLCSQGEKSYQTAQLWLHFALVHALSINMPECRGLWFNGHPECDGFCLLGIHLQEMRREKPRDSHVWPSICTLLLAPMVLLLMFSGSQTRWVLECMLNFMRHYEWAWDWGMERKNLQGKDLICFWCVCVRMKVHLSADTFWCRACSSWQR